MAKPGQEQLVGRTIAGKFRIEQQIGSGAMGAVFRARQIALDKTVAIKVLHGEHADDATFTARFQREAKAASRLNHPNSMQVIDFGAEPDGTLYIAMEYLDGRSLHAVLRQEGPLPAPRIADILMQTLAALAVAHDMGIVHRDLKPENIMVLRGRDDDGRPRDIVKVCDFGIAKITDPRAYGAAGDRESNAPATTAGFLIGTPEYMSPEQGRGERLDPRSDLYSIGVILFEMLAGTPPFKAESAIGVVLRHITEEPPRPSTLRPGADSRLEAVCMRALSKARDGRHASAREMRAELRPVLDARSHVPSADPETEAPASATAATVLQRHEDLAKPTLVGTATAVPGLPRRRGLVVAVASVIAGAAMTAIVAVLARSHAPAAAPAAPATTAPPPAVEASSVPPLAPLAQVQTSEPKPHAPPPAAHPSSHGHPSSSAAAPGKAAAPPSASASASSAPSAPAAPAASASAEAPAPEAPDPSFDPDRGYVEVGLITVEGVREPAVRGALHGAGLGQCYRTALRARGSRVTGVATLSLSFDENGAARSAIATGADFLGGLARCVQAAGAGVRVAKSQVDPGGGTAEAILAFKAP
jgi:serine/threonine-protein kinase